jgi:hypothetical protein
MYVIGSLYRSRQMKQSEPIPLRDMRSATLFPSAFMHGFEEYVLAKIQTTCRTFSYKVHRVQQVVPITTMEDDANPVASECVLLSVAIIPSEYDADTNLKTFSDILNDCDQQVAALCVLSANASEGVVRIVNMFRSEQLVGSRIACALVSLLLFDVLKRQDWRHVDWSKAMVELDDCTGVEPPRNVYYRLGFKVWSKLMEQFVSWDTWYVQRPYEVDSIGMNPDERREILLRDLVWNLSSLLGFRPY